PQAHDRGARIPGQGRRPPPRRRRPHGVARRRYGVRLMNRRLVALASALLVGWSTTVMAEEKRVALEHPLALTDADGKTVTSNDFSGKWLLVYFGYIHCADQCPTALSAMID